MEKRQRLSHKTDEDALERWGVADAAELYGINNWGQNLFSINDNGIACLAGYDGHPEINLKDLMKEIRARGLRPPVLIRFTDILRKRLEEISGAFAQAIAAIKYTGELKGVYPIKVNQHRHILEDIVDFGRQFNFGLEAGSKPELMLAIAHQNNPDALIVCNGFKDRAYVELALRARQMGQRIILVIERYDELPLIVDLAKKMKVSPLIGMRMKLASRGRGMWESSGGALSKFGLTAAQMVGVVKFLKRHKMLDCLQFLHFHIGSQITDIQRIKTALREATAFFAEIRQLGAPIKYLDVGGGLAVDYDGSHTNFASSRNYNLQEYAADVVETIFDVCNDADLPHPHIVTECGRAMTAHHSLLVVEAVASGGNELVVPPVPKNPPEVLKRIADAYAWLNPKNFQEVYHDAQEARKEALTLFSLRHLSLENRAKVEDFFWAICRRIAKYATKLDYLPDDLEGLNALAATIYYCNFSIFQSVPDHWAVKQLFPIMPLQRLNEKPEVQAILADMTCDSDGVIDRFVDLHDVKNTLPLHPLRKNENYELGIFFVGAYQEILGDLHNLFGGTTIVHVSSRAQGYLIDRTIAGDDIRYVLESVEYGGAEVLRKIREQVERALSQNLITAEIATGIMRMADEFIDGETYLQKIES
ncbi:biosynthetic arginine decarboxylase [Planctomycetales bacterium]|nr:biosynthetic arginine decarboxylase [Planctomycetales bacterium]GHS98067.1 biosynthetic arginine decarboxylase [Planctomycetales bacterium]